MYDTNKDFPKIDTKFVMAVFKTITIRDDTRGKPPSEETKQLLIKLKAIEDNIGRVKSVRNGPRLIDLDIILYGNNNKY